MTRKGMITVLWLLTLIAVMTVVVIEFGAKAAKADPPINCWATIGSTNDCGYPNLANTGTTGSLTPYTGIIETTTNDQVIQDLDITGCIVVRNTGVVIQDVKIHGDCYYGVDMNSSYGGSATITDSEIDCITGENTGIGDGGNFTALRVYIHDCENGLDMSDNSSVTDSLIRNREVNNTGHSDGIQSGGGINITIHHNTFGGWNPYTSAMIFDDAANDYLTITDNLIRGGAYSLYCPSASAHDVITGNRFYTAALKLDAYSPYGYTDSCESTATWSGNVVDATNATVNSDGTVS